MRSIHIRTGLLLRLHFSRWCGARDWRDAKAATPQGGAGAAAESRKARFLARSAKKAPVLFDIRFERFFLVFRFGLLKVLFSVLNKISSE
jgi:hypothetical protein